MIHLLLVLSLSAHAQPSDRVWMEARQRVEAAWQVVSEKPKREEAAELRAHAVQEHGYKLFGASFNRTEALAILSLMGDWLRTPRKAKAVEPLIEEAARNAHPQIGDGHAMRSARNWATFVDLLAKN